VYNKSYNFSERKKSDVLRDAVKHLEFNRADLKATTAKEVDIWKITKLLLTSQTLYRCIVVAELLDAQFRRIGQFQVEFFCCVE